MSAPDGGRRWSGCRSTRPSWATRPRGLRYEVVDPTEQVPDSVAEVEVYVPPYAFDARAAEVLSG